MAGRHFVVFEPGDDGKFCAYVPDLPGCVVCGAESLEEAKRQIAEGIEFHIEGLQADGLPVPEPSSQSDYVAVTQ